MFNRAYNNIKPPFGSYIPSFSMQSDKLRLALPLNEGCGKRVFDTSPEGFNGDMNGGVWESGKFGSVVKLNGTSEYIDLGQNLFNIQKVGSIAAYIYYVADAPRTDGIIFSANQLVLQDTIILKIHKRFTGEYRLGYQHYMTTPLTNVNTFGHTIIELATWYFVVAVQDGIKIKLYVNGELQSLTDSGAIDSGDWFDSLDSSTYNYSIGKRTSGGGTVWFEGSVSQLSEYARPLSAEEILELYYDQFKLYQTPLILSTAPVTETTPQFNAEFMLETTPSPVPGIWSSITITPNPVEFILKTEKLLVATPINEIVNINDSKNTNFGAFFVINETESLIDIIRIITGFFVSHVEVENLVTLSNLISGFFFDTSITISIPENNKKYTGFLKNVNLERINILDQLISYIGLLIRINKIIKLNEVPANVRFLLGPIPIINDIIQISEDATTRRMLGHILRINSVVRLIEVTRRMLGHILRINSTMNLPEDSPLLDGFFFNHTEVVDLIETYRILFGFFFDHGEVVHIIETIVVFFGKPLNLYKPQMKAIKQLGLLGSLKIKGVVNSIKQSFSLESLKSSNRAELISAEGLLDSSDKQKGQLDKDKQSAKMDSLKVKHQLKDTKQSGVLDSSDKQKGQLDEDKIEGVTKWTG